MNLNVKWNLYSLVGWAAIYIVTREACRYWLDDSPSITFWLAFMAGVLAGAWYDWCADRRREAQAIAALKDAQRKIMDLLSTKPKQE